MIADRHRENLRDRNGVHGFRACETPIEEGPSPCGPPVFRNLFPGIVMPRGVGIAP